MTDLAKRLVEAAMQHAEEHQGIVATKLEQRFGEVLAGDAAEKELPPIERLSTWLYGDASPSVDLLSQQAEREALRKSLYEYTGLDMGGETTKVREAAYQRRKAENEAAAGRYWTQRMTEQRAPKNEALQAQLDKQRAVDNCCKLSKVGSLMDLSKADIAAGVSPTIGEWLPHPNSALRSITSDFITFIRVA